MHATQCFQHPAALSKNQKKRLKKKLKKLQMMEDDRSKEGPVTDSLVTGRCYLPIGDAIH